MTHLVEGFLVAWAAAFNAYDGVTGYPGLLGKLPGRPAELKAAFADSPADRPEIILS
jgi:hypothetical protein